MPPIISLFYDIWTMRPGNENSLSEVIQEMIRKYGLEEGLWNSKIRDAWQQCIAPAVVQRTTRLNFSNGNLLVVLNSSVLRKELDLMKEDLVTSLNEHLGTPLIQSISFA